MFGNFGNIMDMMGKVSSFKEKFSGLKDELENETFTTTSNDGTVKITMSKLATVKDIVLAEGMDKEQIEDMLVMTLNKALEQVKTEAIDRAKKTAQENLPNIPGMPF
ncbi:YbaB/EbfC family nucleoid-associated protein [Faecalibacter rhinopitheci]|uniref:YbaB/EbfC family nucleoid-associated protein n=1 Tax=Faecalibacter rhinopitheci TaxID=2779678 RepID=A0A8J7FS77_9FLAO|nr:YbaB/EbfC family nucleoid-associated protein [Faecalibacter rhinopitheci]MBF0596622.1 YbaB/EbfC family nucleoid-associated protein [Faecalibacter rhinopitheci]MBQ0147483.1 YbaB/EbfC family nucleoid-associated protein [Candidatus Onthonaster equi]